MAKLRGIFLDVPAANVCVYQMKGKVYLRSKSSLTRKRVLKSKTFEKTRKYASDMGRAAQLGSAIYRELPSAKRNRSLYQTITGMAASLLYQGVGEDEVRNRLKKKFAGRSIQWSLSTYLESGKKHFIVGLSQKIQLLFVPQLFLNALAK